MKVASISLDLDNKWSYLKTRGDQRWRDFPGYLDVLIPIALDFFAQRQLQATFFVVGQDAALAANEQAFSRLGDSGHEIGNHSFHHEPWLHLKSAGEIDDELSRAHAAITIATGRIPVGFRGPGFSFSADSLETVARLGYRYDASSLPTFLGPLARAYYFRKANLSSSARETRSQLFGSSRDFLRPNTPYRWTGVGVDLVEVPVTTFPWLRIPFHFSYLLFLASFSEPLAKRYLQTALRACRLTGVEPSLLLHPLDFLGGDDVSDLEFFPGMRLSGGTKRRLLGEYFDLLAASYELVPLGLHVEKALVQGLRRRPLSPTRHAVGVQP